MSSSSGRYLLLFVFFPTLLIAPASSAYSGRKVGGWTEVEDVETNKEVQDLGHFSVDEYNRRLLLRGGRNGAGSRLLTFSRVVAAQRQVVSGIKYYLRVVAAEDGAAAAEGQRRTFDAVVIVKPWLSSRTLVSFAPRRPALGGQDEDMSRHVNVR